MIFITLIFVVSLPIFIFELIVILFILIHKVALKITSKLFYDLFHRFIDLHSY